MIGELLRLYRAVREIGVRELAAEIGIPSATLNRVERGKPYGRETTLKLMLWLFKKP